MAINMLQLPSYHPGNALDFSSINGAIDTYQKQNQLNTQNKLQQAQLGMQQERLDMEKERFGFEKAQAKRQQGIEAMRTFAGHAQGIEKMTDPAQRSAAWTRLLASHPDAANLPEIYRDPINGPRLALQEAQGFMGQKDQAAIGLTRAQTGMAHAHTDLYRAQAMEERRKAAMPAGGFKDAKQLSDFEEGLRKEYSGHAKPYFEVRDAFTRISQAAANPSPAGDLALIFNYMKLLDPGSVVREGEFATAQNAAGIDDRLRNIYNRLLSGERLNPQQRQDFIGQAQGLYSRAEAQYGATQRQYEELAKRKGIDPRNVILDYGIPKSQGRMDQPAGQKADRAQAPAPAASAAAEPVGARRTINGRIYTKTPQGWVAQ